jgi:hypothetical protein
MSKETHSNGDISWAFDMSSLRSDLACIKIDFISNPWNAAQRFWGYLCDFNLTDRFCATCQ